MSGELGAIIFDVDGTMADTEEAHRSAFNDTFASYDLSWRWSRAQYKKLLRVTGGKERIAYYIREFLKSDPESHDIAFMHGQKTKRYVEIIQSGAVQLRPGVKRLIGDARAGGVKIAIATTTSPQNVNALVEPAFGVAADEVFDAIKAGDCVADKKPAPDVYEMALDQLETPACGCIAIEDSENGLLSATGADIATLVTVNDYTSDQDFSGAVSVVSDLGDPSAPLTPITGAAPPGGFVDLAFLRALLG